MIRRTILALKTFWRDDGGMTTVDWVVMCGAVVALGVAAVTAMSTGLELGAASIETSVINGIRLGRGDGG